MNLMEFKAELEQLEIPIQYQAFASGQAPELPYLIFYENDSDNVFADNHNYYDVLNVSCELYTDEKDIELETKLQKLLYDLEIEYNSTETFIDSENMYMKAYDVTITFDSLADVQEKEIDKSNLKSLVDYVRTLSTVDYTAETWDVLRVALANAEDAYIDDNATQNEVNDVLNKLFEAFKNLQKSADGFEKGVNLYAPLDWQALGLYGGLDPYTGEVSDYNFYIHSYFTKIPDESFSLTIQTEGSDSIYVYFYDENKKFIKREYIYANSKTFEVPRRAKYIRMYSYTQTPSSVLINKTKVEFGEKTDWTIAPEDEEYMNLQLI